MSHTKDYIIDLLNEEIEMPIKAKRICNHPMCNELVDSGYCSKHTPEYKKNYERYRRPEYRKLYNTKAWKTIRERVLIENPFCIECQKINVIKKATDVDHIKDHLGNHKLFFSYSNLQSLCHECHSRKTAKTSGFNKDKNNK